jgi:hypothetical protein
VREGRMGEGEMGGWESGAEATLQESIDLKEGR